MKKVIYHIFTLLLLVNLTGCTVTHLMSGKSALNAGEYDKAAAECQAALEANRSEKPWTLTIDGWSKVNADYFSRLCLGISFGMLGDMDKAKDNLLKSIPFWPEKAFFSYLALGELYYKYDNINEAYRYALKAKETVGTERYEILMDLSSLDRDLWINAVDAAIGFYELRLAYKDLEQQLSIGNKKKAIQIAEIILKKKYKAFIGANGNSGSSGKEVIIDTISKGGMADLNGLMVGDKILLINNRPAANEKAMLHEGNILMTQYGKTVTYRIERQKRIIDIEAKLVYPEIDSTKRILKDLKSNKTDSYQHIATTVSKSPWIKILEPRAGRGVKIVSNQKASFIILASGKNKVASVTVNGIECTSSDADKLEQTFLGEPNNIRKYAITLPLEQGKNRFDITAVDIKGNKTQEQVEIEGNKTLAKELDKIYNRKIAVVIGINRYENSEYGSLDFAVKDAQSVKRQLIKMGFDKVHEIPESEATRSRILRVLGDELPYTLGQNDAFVVYFAGHGDTEELAGGGLEGYILPRDAKINNYKGTAISMGKIREVMKRYKAKHILLVFDSCYSGYGAIMRSGGKSKKLESHVKNAARLNALQIITAGSKDEKAAEDSRVGHGMFTKSFLDSFDNKSIYSGDGILLASDIGLFVRKDVSKKTEEKQNPRYRQLEGEGDFIFENYN